MSAPGPRPANPWDPEAIRWQHSDELVGDEDDSRVAELLGIVPGRRVLEAGCGAGRRSRALAEAGAHVVGIDTSTSMLRLSRCADQASHLARADVTRLPFDDGAFDAALCAYVLDFTQDVTAAITGLRARQASPAPSW